MSLKLIKSIIKKYLVIISKNILPGRGLARPGQGSTLAAAAPGHGQVALETKPVALDPGVPLRTRTHGGVPRDPDLHAAPGHG